MHDETRNDETVRLLERNQPLKNVIRIEREVGELLDSTEKNRGID